MNTAIRFTMKSSHKFHQSFGQLLIRNPWIMARMCQCHWGRWGDQQLPSELQRYWRYEPQNRYARGSKGRNSSGRDEFDARQGGFFEKSCALFGGGFFRKKKGANYNKPHLTLPGNVFLNMLFRGSAPKWISPVPHEISMMCFLIANVAVSLAVSLRFFLSIRHKVLHQRDDPSCNVNALRIDVFILHSWDTWFTKKSWFLPRHPFKKKVCGQQDGNDG